MPCRAVLWPVVPYQRKRASLGALRGFATVWRMGNAGGKGRRMHKRDLWRARSIRFVGRKEEFSRQFPLATCLKATLYISQEQMTSACCFYTPYIRVFLGTLGVF